jgi:hypothetical protein
MPGGLPPSISPAFFHNCLVRKNFKNLKRNPGKNRKRISQRIRNNPEKI